VNSWELVSGVLVRLNVRSERLQEADSKSKSKQAAPPPQDKSDPYYILGIDRSVTASELAARYKQLIKANHPDKVAQLDPEIQAFAEERSKRIIKAYEEVVAGL
jgi:DnaJ-domain-containing protein 1